RSWSWSSTPSRARGQGKVVMELQDLSTQSPDAIVQSNWRELIKPRRLEVDEKSLTPTYGKFFGEPFERGYGITVGNALRRVLLSSLQGAAIVAVRVKSVLHEFSTIPGVTEDVTDIVLNLKEVRVKLHDGDQGQLHRDERPRRPAHRLRPSGSRGAYRRERTAGGRGRVCRPHPAGPALDLRQLRGDGGARGRRRAGRCASQREPLPPR